MKRIAGIIASLAMLVAGSASLGCVIFLADEPEALDFMKD